MVGIYFSGTGNSRYCVEKFLEEYEPQAEAFSIENENAALEIGHQDEIVLGYPVKMRGTAPGRPWGSLASGRIVWAEAVFLL